MHIQELLSEYKLGRETNETPPSERHEITSKFAEKINASRIRDGLKPLQNSFLNKKMADAGLKTNFDLYWFYKYCDETRNFDKTWWWSLKAK